MSINWLEVIASIVNFLILLFLLHRFLYGPIIRVMDEREQKIVQREEEAAGEARRAAKEAASYREKSASLEAQREELLEEARRAAAAEQGSLTAAARREVEQKRKRWFEALARERESFTRELRRHVAVQAGMVARRCLEELADARLEELAWAVFLKKLENLPAEDLTRLKQAALSAGSMQVTSAFALSDEMLQKLKGRLEALTAAETLLEHRQEPGLVCGLELEAGGHRVAWSVESYLENVEQEILKSLDGAEQGREGAADAS